MGEEEWIVGVNAVEQLLKRRPGQVRCLELARSRSGERVDALVVLAGEAGIPCRRLPRERFDQRFPEERHQGVAALAAAPAPLGDGELEGLLQVPDAFVLVLDQVQDPRNLGACLRSAAAAGVHAVVVPRDRSAPLSSVARKAAAGGAERVPVVQVTNLATALDRLKAAGLWLVGAEGGAERPLWALDLAGPIAVVMGGEGRGLRRLTRERCDFHAHIPMVPGCESLNVSVAAGVFLFEILRQRREASA